MRIFRCSKLSLVAKGGREWVRNGYRWLSLILQEGMERREEALQAAMADLIFSFENGKCQIAILDATNSTEARR